MNEKRRIMLVVAYEGTAYHGWQAQKSGADTIEGRLNQALGELTGEDIAVMGASRTDAGVHALCNLAVFDTQSRIPADRFCVALNQRLPDDIVVQSSCEVDPGFHPRHTHGRKTYEYTILNRRIPLPQYRNTACFCYYPLDVEAMRKACAPFLGEHDFAGFCSAGAQVKSTVRTIYALEVTQEWLPEPVESSLETSGSPAADPALSRGSLIRIRVTGDGFLYNMVRIIAGTLLEVGRGRIRPEQMTQIVASRDRSQAGPTAVPQGLRLEKIEIV